MTFEQVVGKAISLGTKVIPLLGVIAFLVFVLGVGRFIKTSGESKEADKGMLIWGVIALFVLFSIWGIVAFLQGEFGFNTSTFGIPQLKIDTTTP